MAKTPKPPRPPVDNRDNSDNDDIAGKTAQSQLAAHHALVKFALGLGELPPRPHEGLLFEEGEGGTENYKSQGKSLGWTWHRAKLGDNHADTRFWRNELLTYLRGERHQFMGAEQCCDGAHQGFHAAGHAVPHLFASLSRYFDKELLTETTWWWGHWLRIARECSTPSGIVLPCGTNIRTPEPHQKLWTAGWRHYTARPNPDAPTQARMVNDRWWTAYWAITQPVCRFLSITVANSLPRMRCPMTVTRTDNGYIAHIDPPAPGDGTVAWKWVCSQVEVAGEQLVGVKRAFEQ